MSDGPHKSLPMNPGWRKVAERGALSSFDPVQIAEAIPTALTEDWRREGCDEFVKELRRVLNDDRQGSLFDQRREEKIEALNKVSPAGYPLRRLVLECVTQAVEADDNVSNAIAQGTERALGERLVRGTVQVEEHYHRKRSEQAASIRGRILEGVSIAPLKELTNRLLKTGGHSASQASPKRDGLDDGVPL